MKILFMGTPDFALPSLRALYEAGEEIIGVVTQPDKPKGRGYTLTPSPIKVYALEKGLPVYQPTTLKGDDFAALLTELDPEMIVVVAFGKILPKNVLDYPKYGCINVHGSLLPKYRGAAPMQRAIMEGERETGVTIMYMDEGLDTGDILSCESFPIEDEDDFEAIHDKSCEIGSALLSRTLDSIKIGDATRTKQNSAEATYAEKIEKADCQIDFSKSAVEIDRGIRGVTPIPGAFAYLNGKMLKIYKASPIEKSYGDFGVVKEMDGAGVGSFTVSCGEGALKVFGVIPEGKGRMSAGDFIRGRKINVGDKFL